MARHVTRRTRKSDRWHAGRMVHALARYFDWWQNRIVTEWDIDGGRADMLVLTRAGYATEVEIKLTRSDWIKDGRKVKWLGASPHVARFFYAIPETLMPRGAALADVLPPNVPEHAGVLVVRAGHGYGGYDQVREERAARRMKAQKLPDAERARIVESYYYRFWRLNMRELERRLYHEASA